MGSEILFLGIPLGVAGVAVVGRRWPRWAYWGIAAALTAGLSALWYSVANVGQPVAAPTSVVLLPVVATFWTVSRERFARKAALASIAGLAAAFGAMFLGIVSGVNLGILRP